MFSPLAKPSMHRRLLEQLLFQSQVHRDKAVMPALTWQALSGRIAAHAHALSADASTSVEQVCEPLNVVALLTALHHPGRAIRGQCYQALLNADPKTQGIAECRRQALIFGAGDTDWCDPWTVLAEDDGQDLQHHDWLVLALLSWPPAPLPGYRQAVLAGTLSPGIGLSQLLVSADLPDAAVKDCWQHDHFPLVFAGLCEGGRRRLSGVAEALRERFDGAAAEQQKLLLALAGLAGWVSQERWRQCCYRFCCDYPQHAEFVLSHQIWKSTLSLVIELMAVVQCTRAACGAWLSLTGVPVPAREAPASVAPVGELLPDFRQAEYQRQAICRRAGDHILAGENITGGASSNLVGTTGYVVEHWRQWQGQSLLATPAAWRLGWERALGVD